MKVPQPTGRTRLSGRFLRRVALDELDRPVGALHRGYLFALSLLAILALANFLILRSMIAAQSQAVEITRIATNQRQTFARVARIVELILRTQDQYAGGGKWLAATREELQLLAQRVRANQTQLNAMLPPDGKSWPAWLNFRGGEDGEPAYAAVTPERLADFSRLTAQLADQIEDFSKLDAQQVEWHFSLWAPIELTLADRGALVSEVNALTHDLYAAALTGARRFSRVHELLAAVTLLTLLAELMFIFHPLLRRLGQRNRRLLVTVRKLRQVVTHDMLTGLGNRLYLNSRLQELLGEPVPKLALVLVDVRNFRSVNDVFGHHIGDQLLKTLAQRLSRVEVPSEGHVFRTGGNEFAVIFLQDLNAAALLQRAQRLRDELNEPIFEGGRELQLKVSIGAAIFEPAASKCGEDDEDVYARVGPDLMSPAPADDVSGQTAVQQQVSRLMHQAGLALRSAKASRADTVSLFGSEDEAMSLVRDALAQRLVRAVGGGDIVPYYQPIVEAGSNRLVAVEALARWITPMGVVLPLEFLLVMEEYGLLDALTDCMLQAVIADRARWQAAGLQVPRIGVNFPEVTLADRRLLARLERLSGSADLSWLSVEIVETVLLSRAHGLVEGNLKQLRRAGAHIALDDFGTGHASLTHLLSLPCDTIKIDRSFVSTMLSDHSSMLIVRGVADIATGLGIRITVEGIECAEQWAVFQAWPGVSGQGLLFGAPMPAQQLAQRLSSTHAAV
ncbi:putative bifunctional diguanylate cyclase/phosphodiesterase [Roseateles sp. BYS180W]|uniref:Bifunctional diguanylate cyclase/phosphodiesterase n=1 Tax=Roseateles rivi TaxID=3299028 RepID=A0ABW7FY54_9BURK